MIQNKMFELVSREKNQTAQKHLPISKLYSQTAIPLSRLKDFMMETEPIKYVFFRAKPESTPGKSQVP